MGCDFFLCSADCPVQIITEDYLIRNAIDEFIAQRDEYSAQFQALQKRKIQWDEGVVRRKKREEELSEQERHEAELSTAAAAAAMDEVKLISCMWVEVIVS